MLTKATHPFSAVSPSTGKLTGGVGDEGRTETISARVSIRATRGWEYPYSYHIQVDGKTDGKNHGWFGILKEARTYARKLAKTLDKVATNA